MIAMLIATAAMAHAGHPAPVHAGHGSLTYWMVQAEIDAGRTNRNSDIGTWDLEAWVGGDVSRVWLKSEGGWHHETVDHAEIQLLYSEPVSDFWDVQVGLRHDVEPEGRIYLVAGFQGLAPFFFETEAMLFLGEDGTLSARLKPEIDLLLTQSLILTPAAEFELFAQDVPELGVGAGLAHAEAQLTLRYEITRKFAPYVSVSYERALGETASIARMAGEDVEATSIRAGVRFWF